MKVKLYCWEPKGCGQHSFYVAARSELKALKAVKKLILNDEYMGEYEVRGFGTDYYSLTVLPVGTARNNGSY